MKMSEEAEKTTMLRSVYSSGYRIGYRSSPAEPLPAGAVRLTRNEIYAIQTKAIDDWQPQRQMWPLQYGHVLLGSMAALSGFACIAHFRRVMQIRESARMASIIPSVVFPGAVTTVAQQYFVEHPIKTGAIVCPLCLELRSIGIQLGAGVLQPLVLSILSASALARLRFTYPLPPISDPRALFNTYLKLMKPFRATLLTIVGINIMFATVTTHMQGIASERLHQSLVELDRIFVS